MSTERSLDGKTVLVTGGAGFIGSHFVRSVLRRHPRTAVVNLDKLTYAGNLDNLEDVRDDPRHEFVLGDIRDRALVRGLFARVQAVVHFAAETHVDRSIYDAGEFVETNVHGTYTLLDALRACPAIELFVHISTDEVYGSRTGRAARESDPLAPSSPYAASKAAGDHLARAYHVTYGLPTVILRPSNTYGPAQFPEKLIPLFLTSALEGRTLPVFGDGAHIREWLYVDDHCRAVEAALLRGRSGSVYNVGGGTELANLDVARRILDAVEAPRELIKFVADRPGHDRRYAMDSGLIRALGWAPETPFAEGLGKTVRWYAAHKSRWRKVRTRPE
jgi:dTDP-glucose 4,6-dehydratase